MLECVSEKGYAKINLHLDITGRIEGGMHSVATVMQTVSLYDEITVYNISKTDKASKFHLTCDKDGVPCDEKNLAYKAALLFCEAIGENINADIDIKKNIPMAAGMAGGSTDAAATLRALNKALGEPLSISELCKIGSQLGADVPFCIVGGTAYADGKGDILHSFPGMPDCAIVAACEGEGVSTPWGYRLLDSIYGDFADGCGYTPKSIEPLKNALLQNDIVEVSKHMYNIFEEPVLAERPVAADVKRLILEGGALSAMMSGSGPSVFGIFMCEKCAARAAELLKNKGYTPYICKPWAASFSAEQKHTDNKKGV